MSFSLSHLSFLPSHFLLFYSTLLRLPSSVSFTFSSFSVWDYRVCMVSALTAVAQWCSSSALTPCVQAQQLSSCCVPALRNPSRRPLRNTSLRGILLHPISPCTEQVGSYGSPSSHVAFTFTSTFSWVSSRLTWGRSLPPWCSALKPKKEKERNINIILIYKKAQPVKLMS